MISDIRKYFSTVDLIKLYLLFSYFYEEGPKVSLYYFLIRMSPLARAGTNIAHKISVHFLRSVSVVVFVSR